MKRIRLVALFVVMISCVGASANTITFEVTASFTMIPNIGLGENASFFFTGQNVALSGQAGTTAWSTFGFAPGSTGAGNMYWLPDYVASGSIGGFPGSTIVLNGASGILSYGAFTFPTNGQSVFTVTVLGFLSGINGTIITESGSMQQFALSIRPGDLTLSYYYNEGLYYPGNASFTSFTTTPEPGTMVLIGTGLIAILGSFRRRLRI